MWYITPSLVQAVLSVCDFSCPCIPIYKQQIWLLFRSSILLAGTAARPTSVAISLFLLDLTIVTDFQDRAAIARALVDACKNVGFAYIINTGIPEEEGELCRVPYPSATLTLILLQSVTRIFDWVGPLHLSVSSYPLSPLHPLL